MYILLKAVMYFTCTTLGFFNESIDITYIYTIIIKT